VKRLDARSLDALRTTFALPPLGVKLEELGQRARELARILRYVDTVARLLFEPARSSCRRVTRAVRSIASNGSWRWRPSRISRLLCVNVLQRCEPSWEAASLAALSACWLALAVRAPGV
jgi:hypothetical protein